MKKIELNVKKKLLRKENKKILKRLQKNVNKEKRLKRKRELEMMKGDRNNLMRLHSLQKLISSLRNLLHLVVELNVLLKSEIILCIYFVFLKKSKKKKNSYHSRKD